jgi:hypothetical protein
VPNAQWPPAGVDPAKPSTARMYDYYLGGTDNFESDRVAAREVIAANPEVKALARANRDFMVRAVRFMSEQGVRQFIDLGTGIPTSPNVHEIAGETHPARVVYVDHDPIVMAHNRALLETRPGVLTVQADLRRPANILNHPGVQRLIDFDEPFGLLIVSVFHFVSDADDPVGIIGRFRSVMAPGSYLAMSVITNEGLSADDIDRIQATYTRTGASPTGRSRARIQEMFTGFDLAEPGLTTVQSWRANTPETRARLLAGVGQKV